MWKYMKNVLFRRRPLAIFVFLCLSNRSISRFKSPQDKNQKDDSFTKSGRKLKLPPLGHLPSDRKLSFSGPRNHRQRSVVAAFKHAWNGYRKYAWGQDHLKPISRTSEIWLGLGLTLMDSLDTLILMDLEEEFKESRKWVKDLFDMNIDHQVNLCETTVHIMGGLLSSFHLTKDSLFLSKATELGNRLMAAFPSSATFPHKSLNLKTGEGSSPSYPTLAELGSIQIEFRDLSRVTGDLIYEDAATRLSLVLHDMSHQRGQLLANNTGLAPLMIDPEKEKFLQYEITYSFGDLGGSYYEYLMKQWIQTGNTINFLREDFTAAIDGAVDKLVSRSGPSNLLFFGEKHFGEEGVTDSGDMDQTVCFLPSVLALGVYHGLPEVHLKLAEELLYTCYLTFARQPTFLAADTSSFNVDGKSVDFVASNPVYSQSAETIESLWYLYYLTGNKTYQDWGWNIFKGIETFTKVEAGFTSLGNIRNVYHTKPLDKMESHFLGETLKYLYLLFADYDKQEIDMDNWIFNTKGHMLPIYLK